MFVLFCIWYYLANIKNNIPFEIATCLHNFVWYYLEIKKVDSIEIHWTFRYI